METRDIVEITELIDMLRSVPHDVRNQIYLIIQGALIIANK